MATIVKARDAGGNQGASTNVLFAVQVVTNRGLIDNKTRINSAGQFLQQFGPPTTMSAIEAYQAAKLGVKLDCYRVGHYTDITDNSTKAGTKATGTVGVTSIVFEALEVGTGYNGIKVDVKEPISKQTGFVDIHVTLPEDNSAPYLVVYNMPTTINDEVKNLLNSKLEFVRMTNNTGTFVAGQTTTLATGAFDISTIVNADYMGNVTEKNGLYAIDFSSSRVDYLLNWVSTEHEVMNAYKEIGKSRNVAAISFFPINISAANAVHYLNATGPYSTETKPNSEFMRIVLGGVEEPHPYRPDQPNYIRFGAAEFMQSVSVKDSEFEKKWNAIGRYEFAMPLTKLVRNYADDNKDLASAGALVFINSFGRIRCKNDRTTLQDVTKNFAYCGIFDLSLEVQRFLELLADKYEERPNNAEELRNPMWLEGTKYMDSLKQKLAIIDYVWRGDQNLPNDKMIVNAQSSPREYKLEVEIFPQNNADSITIFHTYKTA